MLNDEKITISLNVKGFESPINIFLDNIYLNLICETIDDQYIRLLKNPGFKLRRIIDNKKSWVRTEDYEHREYDLTYRETDYKVNHSDLIINSKEIDLNVDSALAIETDVYKYITENEECFLSGDSVDFSVLLTTPLSSITSIDEFRKVVKGEFVDAKTRQTSSAYPTLKAVYDKYFIPLGCPENGTYNYELLISYNKKLGNFWIELVEQVVPSTSIWGSTTVYRNTIFDDMKFKYRVTNITPMDTNDIPNSEICKQTTKSETNIEVMVSTLDLSDNPTPPQISTMNDLYVIRDGSNSEFFGKVTIDNQNLIAP
jgi:hypothetical protein